MRNEVSTSKGMSNPRGGQVGIQKVRLNQNDGLTFFIDRPWQQGLSGIMMILSWNC